MRFVSDAEWQCMTRRQRELHLATLDERRAALYEAFSTFERRWDLLRADVVRLEAHRTALAMAERYEPPGHLTSTAGLTHWEALAEAVGEPDTPHPYRFRRAS